MSCTSHLLSNPFENYPLIIFFTRILFSFLNAVINRELVDFYDGLEKFQRILSSENPLLSLEITQDKHLPLKGGEIY